MFAVKETDCKMQVQLSQVESKMMLLKIFELPSDDKKLFAIPFLHDNF